MGAPKWPPYPQSSERPGQAVALLVEAPMSSEPQGGAVGARVGAAGEPVGIDADDLGVSHQVAPVVDDLHVVPALPERRAHGVAEPRLEPQ